MDSKDFWSQVKPLSFDMTNNNEQDILYTTLDIPGPLPIPEYMSDTDVLSRYGLDMDSDINTHITDNFMMLQHWHRALESNMARLVRMEHGYIDRYSEEKSEVVRKIFEFSGRYIRDCKSLIDGMESRYGNDLGEKDRDHYLNNKYDWNKQNGR